jgi:hypothetical protein
MIWNWFCATGSAFATAKIRRRTQFLISTAGMLIIFAAQTLCAGLYNEHGNQSAGNTVIAMLFLFYTFYNFAFNALLYLSSGTTALKKPRLQLMQQFRYIACNSG